ncbi:S9 family peptidase [Pseudoxanthomonas sp. JBR18]|uniref:S9 family peptidase n=1 Tax=Pseudoxanthomonas sp. JBR18 TaxID=2969308 RepID=UPI002305D448|nr:S9 family peptidase [Pseudoxanthomonas sp. JBR18]WCE02737.1 DPP IV N-terminal domain-containing protein [Pseudoxanthomonas sp. JBR18]
MLLNSIAPRLIGALVLTAAAASAGAVTEADYARAAKLAYAQPLVDHAVTRVTWLDAGHFVYTDHDASGDRLLQTDTATGKTAPLFDADALAAALTTLLEAKDKPVKADKLGIRGISTTADGRYRFSVRGTEVACDAQAHCAKVYAKAEAEPGALSPDKKSEAFIRDWNLWVRDLATGKETQLTTDGVTDYGYATDNAGWKHTDMAIVEWSPDSKKIATFQQDQRKTSEMYLVSTQVGAPKLEAWKYPLPGDKDVTMIERVIIDVPTRKVTRLKMEPDQHRSTLCDDISCGPDGGWDDVKWAPDSKTVAFVSTSRYHKDAWFRIADADTGAVRTVFSEHVKTQYESGNGTANWAYLPQTNEAVWFSERSNWGQLYLYDLTTGKLKHAITTGEGNVTEMLKVDPATRTVWFRGVGRTAGINPYYQQFWKVSLDGGKPTLLTPEASDHTVSLSPDGKLFVDAYSTTTVPPVTVLRSAADGQDVAPVAKADITRLKAIGWVPPEPFTVKARDGKTDLYGIMFKPSDFDPSKKYPIVNYIYPGPQTGSVRGRSFLATHGDNQSLAELGFIVVAIDGMGTPWRSKAFHDTWYGDMADNTLPDQVAGMKELGAKYPWIDLSRAGIWGHSGGGNASTAAILRYPDFFKVAWSESGNHDNRGYEDDWGERYQGELIVGKDGKGNYDSQANASLAGNLKGHLMLVHGTMDDNVPPYLTLLVVDALMKANKDFDMLMIPNVHHGYGAMSAYIARRRWDYFVRYLAGETPPKDFKLEAPKD